MYCCVVVPLTGKAQRVCVIIVVLVSILAQSLACHWAKEVWAKENGPHAYRQNGCWLIGWQTDDLNEWRERIRCLLSSPFIPLSCPPFISPSFQGEGLVVYGGLLGGVGTFLAGYGNQWGYYYWHTDHSSGWLEGHIDRHHRDRSCTLNNENIQLIYSCTSIHWMCNQTVKNMLIN